VRRSHRPLTWGAILCLSEARRLGQPAARSGPIYRPPARATLGSPPFDWGPLWPLWSAPPSPNTPLPGNASGRQMRPHQRRAGRCLHSCSSFAAANMLDRPPASFDAPFWPHAHQAAPRKSPTVQLWWRRLECAFCQPLQCLGGPVFARPAYWR